MNEQGSILNIPAVKYFIAVTIIVLLPVFYILFNVATPRYIYFPYFHIYAATVGLLVLAVSLIFYPRMLAVVSIMTISLLSSWIIQNIALSTFYLWNLSLKSDKWQPLSLGESLRTVVLGNEVNGGYPSYWLVALIPLALCVILLWEGGKMNNTSNQSPDSIRGRDAS